MTTAENIRSAAQRDREMVEAFRKCEAAQSSLPTREEQIAYAEECERVGVLEMASR